MENEFYVLIVEDKRLAKELLDAHFDAKKISYAGIFKQENREKVTTAISQLD